MISTHIQAIHVLASTTQIVYGDDQFVTFDSNRKLVALGFEGRTGDHPRVNVEIAEGEDAPAFINRANEIEDLASYSLQDLQTRIAYALSCLDQPWIETKRRALFGR